MGDSARLGVTVKLNTMRKQVRIVSVINVFKKVFSFHLKTIHIV